jgi:hypothetical protein
MSICSESWLYCGKVLAVAKGVASWVSLEEEGCIWLGVAL